MSIEPRVFIFGQEPHQISDGVDKGVSNNEIISHLSHVASSIEQDIRILIWSERFGNF